MIPVDDNTTDHLEAIHFKVSRRPDRAPLWCEYVRPGPPTSFESFWRPSWRDIWRLIFGGMVRVSVNYSMYGPLYVDAVKRGGEGFSTDWLDDMKRRGVIK